MGLTELFVMAVVLSMDAFAVAVCKGLALGKIKLRDCAWVGLWFGAFQAPPDYAADACGNDA